MKNVCQANAGLKCDYRFRRDREGFNECTYLGECPSKITGKEKLSQIKESLEVD